MSDERTKYQQRHLFKANPPLMATKGEDQWFDRKSARIAPAALADVMIGFANAEGGTILVGVEDDGRITGLGNDVSRLNGLQQAAIDFTEPLVRHATDTISCETDSGATGEVLAIEIPPSDRVHRNRRGDVFLRFGDQTRRLGPDEIRELTFDKGEHPFDATPAPGASMGDLAEGALASFAERIGTPGDPRRALRVRHLLTDREHTERVTWGALLLFGRTPEAALPQAYLRFLRYEGTEPQTGTRLNLVFDRRIEGSLPEQIERAQEVMVNQVRQITRLDETGRFVTIPEIPRFAWLEAIVNAVTHRSYSLQGDHIRVKMFDDRIEVESPGRLPGPVRIDNIRNTRFSRNPRISRVLADLGVVRELNEGVNRMFEEMTAARLPEPRFRQTDAGVQVTLFNTSDADRAQLESMLALVPDSLVPVLNELFAEGRITTGRAAEITGVTAPTVRRYLRILEDARWIERVARSPKDPNSHWRLSTSLRGRWHLRAKPSAG